MKSICLKTLSLALLSFNALSFSVEMGTVEWNGEDAAFARNMVDNNSDEYLAAFRAVYPERSWFAQFKNWAKTFLGGKNDETNGGVENKGQGSSVNTAAVKATNVIAPAPATDEFSGTNTEKVPYAGYDFDRQSSYAQAVRNTQPRQLDEEISPEIMDSYHYGPRRSAQAEIEEKNWTVGEGQALESENNVNQLYYEYRNDSEFESVVRPSSSSFSKLAGLAKAGFMLPTTALALLASRVGLNLNGMVSGNGVVSRYVSPAAAIVCNALAFYGAYKMYTYCTAKSQKSEITK